MSQVLKKNNNTIIVISYACVSHDQSIDTACVHGTSPTTGLACIIKHFLSLFVNGNGFDSAVLRTQNFKNVKETLFLFLVHCCCGNIPQNGVQTVTAAAPFCFLCGLDPQTVPGTNMMVMDFTRSSTICQITVDRPMSSTVISGGSRGSNG